eukprot:3938876-Rhodomonas_salina.1
MPLEGLVSRSSASVCRAGRQVVHYDPGQKYDLHNDWFDPSSPYYADRVRLRGPATSSPDVEQLLSDADGRCGLGGSASCRFSAI